MARRILLADAEDPEWVQTRYALQVDEYVEVHWKLPVAMEDWSGDVTIEDHGYQITLRDELPRSPLQVYARLVNAEDIDWLNKAVRADPKKRLIARVNEVKAQRGNRPTGFQIEVLTGPDAQALSDTERLKRSVSFLRAHWWKIGLVLIVAWWLIT